MDNNIVFFGLTSFRNARKKFGIKIDDRRRHFYVIGKTGMGKSNLMEQMAIQDIQAGRGVAYIDPHGEGAEKILDFVPADRINDVIYINPSDIDYPIAFNVVEKVDFRYRHLVASGLMGVFKKVWPDVWSARMEYILNNSILALLEYPDATLLGVNRMFADIEYRKRVVDKITDPIVKSFWVTEYARYTQRYEIEATAAIQNKVGQFISNPLVRNIIGQTKSTINMREIMDDQKILIMNLSKGKIGEDNSKLLGALLITKLQLAAMSRVDIPEEDRKDFYLYVDEFQNFATESFTNILSEARKYRLNLILGHQYITQMEETVRDAVFGNVGTLVVFRVGAEDAEFLEKEFTPEFTATDLCNLPKYNIYLKLMIDGIAGHPFSAETLPPPVLIDASNKDKIIRASQEKYGVKSEIVQEKISRWASFLDDTLHVQAVKPLVPPQQDTKKETESSAATQTTLYDAICSMLIKK
ncbi:MAG: type IV secretion system DNA-binding domain-containing protein [Candidatus Staskawiczbacteria bacterium]|nr:type IV secretion system DNA-binding domain-containing protein [Candidatus Staskawiczbacteria bacterium]